MSKQQFKTYCRIPDYVEVVDPDLATLINGLCGTTGALSAGKGKAGVTFLMPQDKAFRAKLEKLAYSDKTEDASKASDMMMALIMRDSFKTPAEWKNKEVANSLFPSQLVEVESVSAKEVVFKSGARAVLDEGFKDASKKSNLAVWKLVSGEIPVTTDKPASNAKPKKKTGAYAPSAEFKNLRWQIAAAVENTYALNRLSNNNRNAYLDYTMSFVNYVLTVRKDTALVCDKILPLLAFDKMDFYFILEPHRSAGEYLIDDELVAEWWQNKKPHDAKTFSAELEVFMKAGKSSALVYADRPRLFDEIASVRALMMRVADAKSRFIVQELTKVYQTLESENKIGNAEGVYPTPLAEFYAANPGLKMVHDELRFVTYGAFKQFEARAFDYGAFNELMNMVGECLYASTADERARSQKLLNANNLRKLISPNENVDEIKVFINSTMFMFMPMTCAEASELRQKHSISRPDPSSMVIFNIAKDLYNQHNRMLTEENTELATLLKTLNPDTIDPELRELLRKKFA